MRASDVMVTTVITVSPDTSVREIAKILISNRISAVPVVDQNGTLVGIVSEGDFIHRAEVGTERHNSWWLDFLGGKGDRARDFVKSHAVKAADIMSKPVITAGPDMPLGELASLLEKRRIKRVPIVENGKIVGIVSRANLVQALASMGAEIADEAIVDDATLRTRVLAEINSNVLDSGSQVNVIVRDGAVELWGFVDSGDEKDAIRIAAELTRGVRAVVDHLAVQRYYSAA